MICLLACEPLLLLLLLWLRQLIRICAVELFRIRDPKGLESGLCNSRSTSRPCLLCESKPIQSVASWAGKRSTRIAAYGHLMLCFLFSFCGVKSKFNSRDRRWLLGLVSSTLTWAPPFLSAGNLEPCSKATILWIRRWATILSGIRARATWNLHFPSPPCHQIRLETMWSRDSVFLPSPQVQRWTPSSRQPTGANHKICPQNLRRGAVTKCAMRYHITHKQFWPQHQTHSFFGSHHVACPDYITL